MSGKPQDIHVYTRHENFQAKQKSNHLIVLV